MEWASLAVAILSSIGAGFATYFTWQHHKREQARFQREEIEAKTTRMARPSTDLLGPGPGPGRTYRFRVTNIGQAAMWDLEPTLVDNSGAVVSVHPMKYLNGLQAGEREEFEMTVAASIDARAPLHLRYEWGDDYGKREHVSGVKIPGV